MYQVPQGPRVMSKPFKSWQFTLTFFEAEKASKKFSFGVKKINSLKNWLTKLNINTGFYTWCTMMYKVRSCILILRILSIFC